MRRIRALTKKVTDPDTLVFVVTTSAGLLSWWLAR